MVAYKDSLPKIGLEHTKLMLSFLLPCFVSSFRLAFPFPFSVLLLPTSIVIQGQVVMAIR